MTKKLIYLEDALDALAEQLYHNEEDYRTAVKAIGGLPSAQPEVIERKKGKWLDSQGKEKYVGYCAECSACGGWSEYITDFCPNCGADMRGEEDG